MVKESSPTAVPGRRRRHDRGAALAEAVTKGDVGEVQSPKEQRTVKESWHSVASSARNGGGDVGERDAEQVGKALGGEDEEDESATRSR